MRRRSLEADLKRYRNQALLRHGSHSVQLAVSSHLACRHDGRHEELAEHCYLCKVYVVRRFRSVLMAQEKLRKEQHG